MKEEDEPNCYDYDIIVKQCYATKDYCEKCPLKKALESKLEEIVKHD